MTLFSAISKAKELIAPFAFGSTAASMSQPANATRPQSSRPLATQQKRGLQIHRVKSGKVEKTKATHEKGKTRQGLSDHSKILDKGDGSTINTDHHDESLVKIDFKEYIPKTDRFIRYSDPKYKSWASEEIWLFNKLSRRGYEPLLRLEWQLDFLSFPDNLFSKDEELVHIKNLNTNISEATNELVVLVDAGPRCRDALLQKQRPEPPLKKAIERYKKWSIRDAKLHRRSYIDLIAVTTAEPDETVQSVADRMTDNFHTLARKWRNKLRHSECQENDDNQRYTHKLPTLYGFMIKYSVVAVVTFDSRSLSNPIRTLTTLNHQIDGIDVWHALAISIVCCRARNHLLQLEKEGCIGAEIPTEDDPDA